MFQSLAGFRARCDAGGGYVYAYDYILFQSLAGFQARCDPLGRVGRPGRPDDVSIPGGFSGSLRPNSNIAGTDAYIEFQSLAGFQARCDADANNRKGER